MKVILLGHRQDVGKDTYAGFLKNVLQEITAGQKVIITGFATDLKATAYKHYAWAGLKEESYYYPDRKEELAVILPQLGITPRQVYIKLGQQLREIHPDCVYQAVVHNYKVFKTDYLILKDFRYPTEYRPGTIAVRIDNPRVPVFTDGADEILKDFTKWDRIVDNSGSLKDLFNDARIFAQEIVDAN